MMLTVFTSESSINRRKQEIQTLRAKGASYNQIIGSLMSESLILSFLGFIVGMLLAVYLAPLLGASSGLLTIDQELYATHLSYTAIQSVTIAIAGIISLYLPGAYLYQVSRLVDISEIGQPMTTETPDEVEVVNFRGYVSGLLGTLSLLFLLPVAFSPSDIVSVFQMLVATGLFYAASFFGSKVVRLLTARGDRLHRTVLGEKSLYVLQSFNRRKGHFLPLLLILTLTLSTTTMILIQSASFDSTMRDEIQFAIGADIRVECDGLPLSYVDNLTESSIVREASPVVQSVARYDGDNPIMLLGIDAIAYSNIAEFPDDCFNGESSLEVLSRLNSTERGIIISTYHAILLNKNIGDSIQFLCDTNNTWTVISLVSFEIVGLMTHAPGFGSAANDDKTNLMSNQLGFQMGQQGFAFANLRRVLEFTDFSLSDLFLVRAEDGIDSTDFALELDEIDGIRAFSVETFDLEDRSPISSLFISGLKGHLTIEAVACLVMGLSSIGLFLGSAVMKRQNEYAVIRAIGGTRRQIRAIVFGEFAGTVLSALLVSMVLGLVFGMSMTSLTFGISPFDTVIGYNIVIPYDAILGTIGIEILVLVLACLIPAMRAGHTEPITILRNL
ncbi:MAG: FtsX-like permease family protein, partial [Candidatus Thorarchaeota archaeon]|jgi:ABC-type antimicrobial peptide transport system permease subunit